MNIVFHIFVFCIYNPILNLFSIVAYILNFITSSNKLKNRLCLNLPTINHKVIWIHGASVGELNSITQVIKSLLVTFPNYHILITSHTLTSKDYILTYFKNTSNLTHIYLPYDSPYLVSKFINFYQIQLVLWLEQDLFVNMLRLLKKHKTPLILLNARISDKSFKRWSYLKCIIKPLLNTFNNIYAMSLADKNKIEILAHSKVNYIGNLKYTTLQTYKDNAQSPMLNEFKKYYTNSNILLGLSTHDNEEDMLVNTHVKLLEHIPNLITIIIPRHIHRSFKIVKQLTKKYNVKIGIWDDKQQDFNSNIMVINKIGFTNIFCTLSNITFVGRSLSKIKKGGQNLLEPLACGSVVLFGKNMHNFQNIVTEILEHKGAVQVSNLDELYNNVYHLFNNHQELAMIKRNALAFLNKKDNLLNQYMEIIQCYLKN